MCADVGDGHKVGSSRNSSKLKQDNRRRVGKKVVVAGLRTSDCEEEMFALIVKMLGNGMCEVSCADGANRLCIIRKKFRGRQKHKNIVSVGATVMVGLRPWEKNERSSMQKCDLLEVYSESELRKLKQRGALNMDKASRTSVVTEADEIEFATGGEHLDYGDDEVGQQPQRDYDLSQIDSGSEDGSDEDIDVDDI
jgi:translation initiation factor 1A